MSDDPAHILFPSDAPRPAATPDWYRAQATAAETRLAGGQRQEAPSAVSLSAESDRPNAADQLFVNEDNGFDDRVVSGFLDPFTLGAIGDGDEQRAGELKAATAALSEDFRAAGTDSNELKAAFEILREANDHVVPPTPEKVASDMNESLTALQAELGPSFQLDLNAARAFIRDLEIVAPGTIASLEHNGAGNDLRLIKAAIREARRRKY